MPISWSICLAGKPNNIETKKAKNIQNYKRDYLPTEMRVIFIQLLWLPMKLRQTPQTFKPSLGPSLGNSMSEQRPLFVNASRTLLRSTSKQLLFRWFYFIFVEIKFPKFSQKENKIDTTSPENCNVSFSFSTRCEFSEETACIKLQDKSTNKKKLNSHIKFFPKGWFD